MKKQLFIFTIFFSLLGYSQKDTTSIYFPQEQLIHPDCTDAEDKNACLKNIIQTKFQEILNEQIKYVITTKDTISTSVTFRVNPDGSIKDSTYSSFVYITNIKTEKKSKQKMNFEKISKKKMNTFLLELPKFEVLNKKEDIYNAKHSIYNYFSITKEKNLSLIQDKKNNYKGATIEETPIFPGCRKHKYEKERRKCFSEKMISHVKKNFRYPKKAQRKGIKGKVSIMFKISTEGKVFGIRKRGPHPLLEEEAVRIIKLLPNNFKPGKQNGKPVIVPFSLPISFKLQ